MRQMARVLSVLLHPAVLQGLYVFLPMGAPAASPLTIALVLGLAAILPLALSGLYLRRVGVEDLFTIPREKRMIPFLFSLSCLCLSWFLIQESHPWAAQRLIHVFLLNLTAFLLTQREKVSLHVLGITAVTVLWYPGEMTWVGLALPVVVWARKELKAHTPFQLWAGGIAGALVALVIRWW